MKNFIPPIFDTLIYLIRIFVIFGAITYVAIQTIEIFQRKEFMHLTIFTLFFLFASFQLSASAYFYRSGMKKYSDLIFTASIIMFSAGVFELVDVALDHLLKDLANLNNSFIIIFGSLIEYFISLSSVFVALISLDRFSKILKGWSSTLL